MQFSKKKKKIEVYSSFNNKKKNKMMQLCCRIVDFIGIKVNFYLATPIIYFTYMNGTEKKGSLYIGRN